MPALPGRPDFPVFGLAPSFVGRRWVVVWNDRDRLYTVTLGHGQPDPAGTWVCVTTVHKTSVDGLAPTGLHDAFFSALGQLTAMAHPGTTDAGPRHALMLRLAGEWEAAADHDGVPPNWAPTPTAVDGTPHPGLTRTTDTGWATVLDLPSVALAVSGPGPLPSLELVDVTGRLADYAD